MTDQVQTWDVELPLTVIEIDMIVRALRTRRRSLALQVRYYREERKDFRAWMDHSVKRDEVDALIQKLLDYRNLVFQRGD